MIGEIMEKQFKNNITFFDLNIENDDKNNFPFATLYFYVKGLNLNFESKYIASPWKEKTK